MHDGPLRGQAVVVTSHASGFGAELAEGLVDLGAAVVVVDALGSASSAQSAFTDASDAIGPLTGVVHAVVPAEALRRRDLADTDAGEWDQRGEAVLRETLWCMQAAFASLQAGGGAIVLITPTVALFGAAELVPYTVAVEGQRAMAKAAARQWGVHGIRVNCVAPSLDLFEAADGPAVAALADPSLDRLPEVRTDVARVVASLLADLKAVTGATIVVDGGVVMAP